MSIGPDRAQRDTLPAVDTQLCQPIIYPRPTATCKRQLKRSSVTHHDVPGHAPARRTPVPPPPPAPPPNTSPNARTHTPAAHVAYRGPYTRGVGLLFLGRPGAGHTPPPPSRPGPSWTDPYRHVGTRGGMHDYRPARREWTRGGPGREGKGREGQAEENLQLEIYYYLLIYSTILLIV